MKKINIIPAFIVILFLNGCSDFLDKELQNSLTQEAFPVTESDALLATNTTYTTLREWFYHSGGYPILDFMSDDAHKGSNPNDQLPTLGPYETFGHTPSQDGLDRWWNTLYLGVKRCNVVLDYVPEIQMNPALRDRYLAEASFIRGLLYFDMVRAWGGIPLVTSTNPPASLGRSDAEEVYALIIADLEVAVRDLPERNEYSGDDKGRATKGAAKALLAKVYLFRQEYTKAEPLLMEVINSGLYGLEPVFTDANSVNGNHGIESVFEIGAMQLESTDAGGNQYANTQGVRGTPNRGWGFNRPSLDLRNAFEQGDPRLKGTIIDLGDVIDGVTILGDGSTPDETTDEDGNVIEVECYNRKVWVPGTTTITQWGHQRRLIRYADVLLMAAEVLNENNKPGMSIFYLNMVRARAREGNNSILPDIMITDQALLRDIILQERRYELAMEGHRYWDLVRTGKAPEVLGPHGFVTGKHELLPIPQTEIDISQGTLSQNPNW
ncbi:MAG: RagB/SusD family nutrient uptake outer membrane protein [Bacteroidales bacterium]|nr:RagB/SusD family nutrient uptake outer membrane protein [Bacteroidales bacterium]